MYVFLTSQRRAKIIGTLHPRSLSSLPKLKWLSKTVLSESSWRWRRPAVGAEHLRITSCSQAVEGLLGLTAIYYDPVLPPRPATGWFLQTGVSTNITAIAARDTTNIWTVGVDPEQHTNIRDVNNHQLKTKVDRWGPPEDEANVFAMHPWDQISGMHAHLSLSIPFNVFTFFTSGRSRSMWRTRCYWTVHVHNDPSLPSRGT